jgi:23S rRNA pseudouridine1911/1915/1917 synthase
MAVREDGREALTHWTLVEPYRGPGVDADNVASLIECRLETGRTHQIRVHLASIGHPVLGDEVYGAGFKTKATRLGPAAHEALARLGRQALHAYLLGLEHPVNHEYVEFRSELPADLQDLRKGLREVQGGPAPKVDTVEKKPSKTSKP